MVVKLLTWLFDQLIGQLSERQKQELRTEFHSLLQEAVSAAASGAVKGMRR